MNTDISDVKNGFFVYETSVKTRHMYADMLQWVRNALGMNLISYESMINASINEALEKLNSKYELDPHSIKISTAQAAEGAMLIIVSGVAIRAK